MNIQQISDHLGISALLYQYARAVDGNDWDEWRAVFTDDAHVDYSSAPGGRAGSRNEIAEWLAANLSLLPWTQHYITNIETNLDGDTATVRAMFYNPMQFPHLDDVSSCGGYYHHHMVRTADGWRSRALREENVWFINPPFPQPTVQHREPTTS